MKNSIAERIRDYLIIYPPFDLLEAKKLLEISEDVIIIYLEKGDTLFKAGDTTNKHFYMVRDGAISLNHEKNGTKEIVTISELIYA